MLLSLLFNYVVYFMWLLFSSLDSLILSVALCGTNKNLNLKDLFV